MLNPTRKHEAVAELESVNAGYYSRDVLKDISLQLQSSMIADLAGPNGAGKSTLIRLLTGTLPPRGGTVRCETSQISLVPQEIALYPWLTARENCLAFSMMDGTSRREASIRAARALEMTECDDVAAIRVSQLSGGYRRRINIAVAMMAAPRLMILDEPTAGLDADAKRVVQDVMTRIRDTDCGILIVTHDFDVVEHIADRVFVLFAGRLIRDMSPGDLIESVCAGRRPIELHLAAVPDERQFAFLSKQGAVPYGRTRWVVQQERGDTDLGPISAAIAEVGLRVVEMRVREPNLADAYSILIKSEGRPS
jgi:ABC-2 type transport system ATP-binding protein